MLNLFPPAAHANRHLVRAQCRGIRWRPADAHLTHILIRTAEAGLASRPPQLGSILPVFEPHEEHE